MIRYAYAAAAALLACTPVSAATFQATINTTLQPYFVATLRSFGAFGPLTISQGDTTEVTINFLGEPLRVGAIGVTTLSVGLSDGALSPTPFDYSVSYEYLNATGSILPSGGPVARLGQQSLSDQLRFSAVGTPFETYDPDASITGVRLTYTLLNGAPQTLSRFNVDVDPVPEPATWAMMLLGFGAIGGAIRARSGRRAIAV